MGTPKQSIIKTEPAVVVSTVTALLTALLGFGAAFGLDLSDAQRNAVIGVVAPAVAVIALVGPVIRGFVYSPSSTQELVIAARETGTAGETPPVLPT